MEKIKKVPKTIYLEKKHIEYIEKLSIKISPWISEIFNKAIIIREKKLEINQVLEEKIVELQNEER